MLIECDEPDEILEGEEEVLLEPRQVKTPEIFLHAVEGSSAPTTIRILGQVNNKPVSILVDSGSTHNFFRPQGSP